jgi:ParB family chromosome partitioning protein
VSATKQSATMLPIEQLIPHTGNIRDDLGNLDELAQSIREHGIIQPIVVTEHPAGDGTWLILAGHRRTAAAKLAGLTHVPTVIRHGTHALIDQIALMLVENLQRRDLGPIEKAEAIGALINFGMTQTDIARSLGIKVPSVNYYVTLLELDEESREQVRRGELGAVEAISGVRQDRIARRRATGNRVIGRPVQVEPRHFIRSHDLASYVAELCDHTRRPKVGGVGCGQCWEEIIRTDALGGIGGGSAPMPSRAREVDEVAVQRRIAGDHSVRLNIAEKREAIRILHNRGLSDGQIASTIGHTARQVLRIRQELDLPANVDAGGNQVTAR